VLAIQSVSSTNGINNARAAALQVTMKDTTIARNSGLAGAVVLTSDASASASLLACNVSFNHATKWVIRLHCICPVRFQVQEVHCTQAATYGQQPH
jgi:hypothetical protein